MRTRRLACFLVVFCLAGVFRLRAQQANINLDWNPQKNTENLIPFSANLNSPDVRDDRRHVNGAAFLLGLLRTSRNRKQEQQAARDREAAAGTAVKQWVHR